MKDDLLRLTPEQLAVYTELQRIRMAWVTLPVILALFAIGFLAFLYALFHIPQQGLPKTIVGGIDTLLGFALKTIITYLFPPPPKRKK